MRGLTSIIFKNAKRNDSNGRNFLLDLAFFIVFAVLSGTMAIFSYIITKELMEIEQSYLFINILLLINFILLFAKSIFECLNVLYFSKDLKILLRMPIKSKDIVHAKFLNMIVSEYHMEYNAWHTNDCIWTFNKCKCYILFVYDCCTDNFTGDTYCNYIGNFSDYYAFY